MNSSMSKLTTAPSNAKFTVVKKQASAGKFPGAAKLNAGLAKFQPKGPIGKSLAPGAAKLTPKTKTMMPTDMSFSKLLGVGKN
jgi:hypothetical protein